MFSSTCAIQASSRRWRNRATLKGSPSSRPESMFSVRATTPSGATQTSAHIARNTGAYCMSAGSSAAAPSQT
jgi:hypothetical protein